MSDVKPISEEQRQQWIAALRSGKYEQGLMNLRATDAGTGRAVYCCLGVARELFDVPVSVDDEGGVEELVDYRFIRGKQQVWLAAKNDEGVPFEQIAEIIENTPLADLQPPADHIRE